ncbi:outer membrane protein assembly factor BamD [Pantoea sp. Nvir]|uniref:outer membrane protein assembly factor BamD n=1 Tax=Pantoea sp. Nvir TaxID=2576760 RepID=UPI0013570114|nr:outer membrane protein assembly factor BamD [Pantoea sp. Nvir]MXP66707.1 outer membrane protein assembly factor BamD [Pantoea sp. Nvir]
MKYVKYLVVAVLMMLNLVGCTISTSTLLNLQPSDIYAKALVNLHMGNFREAIKYLENVDKYYPFSIYAQQTQLELIYAYYKITDMLLAKEEIERFINLHPDHPNLDYVIYMRGVINMYQNNGLLLRLLNIDNSDIDPTQVRDAFRDFSQLIHKYPNSQYATDARKRLVYLKNRLAKHELLVAQFYTRRKAYVAVVNRVEGMMRDYLDTQATRDALPLMENAYRELQLNEEADKVAKIIAANSALLK